MHTQLKNKIENRNFVKVGKIYYNFETKTAIIEDSDGSLLKSYLQQPAGKHTLKNRKEGSL